ncbi:MULTISPECIES: hypothetical protein [unclassified Streptomyces]|uniref:hypothetical protein n=1 Tax=unclassified Streptomyces TaxID=2593676 RepID=UPI002E79FE84|nr:hypothetical protein [Streptomyces sp. JV184]MEE1746315.1 hypothetical protein [Streptomyces sp. JV184]
MAERDPMGNLAEAWTRLHIGDYFPNTVWVVAGCWFFGLLVALTGGYTIAVLKPRWAPLLSGAIKGWPGRSASRRFKEWTMRVILDTDVAMGAPGYEIDDGFALALIAAEP